MIAPLDLISPAYREEQRMLHARPGGYGGKGNKWAGPVEQLAKRYGATSVLDYGCGQGSLGLTLRAIRMPGVRFDDYDPAVIGKDHLPMFADLVVCTDVLEHIEPDRLDGVLAHLHMLARKAVFLVVATRPSSKVLTDGRNAHLILEDEAWWSARVAQAGFAVELGPKSPSPKPSREWVAVAIPRGVPA